MKKWLLRIINGVSVLIIVFALFVLLTVVTTGSGKAPCLMGHYVFRVMTGSMEPSVPEDSMIIVKKTDPSEIREGDVITYYSSDPTLNGAVNTHRVTEISREDGKTVFITKGDANALEDHYPVSGDALLGRVIYVSAGLGNFVNFLSSPAVFILLIIVPLILMLISNLIRTVSSARKIMKEEEEEAVRQAVEAARRKLEEKEQKK